MKTEEPDENGFTALDEVRVALLGMIVTDGESAGNVTLHNLDVAYTAILFGLSLFASTELVKQQVTSHGAFEMKDAMRMNKYVRTGTNIVATDAIEKVLDLASTMAKGSISGRSESN